MTLKFTEPKENQTCLDVQYNYCSNSKQGKQDGIQKSFQSL